MEAFLPPSPHALRSRIAARLDAVSVPGVAAALVLVTMLIGWRGGDWPAQIYRTDLVERMGLTIWNAQWYGGHWTLTYSTLFPAIASKVGLYPVALASVVAAAWAFDRLAIVHFGARARVASYAYVFTLIAAVVIGQLTFLLGLAFGSLAVLGCVRHHWWIAVPLAACAALSSPLAAAFLAMVVVAIAWSDWPRHRVPLASVLGAAVLPVAVLAVLFPGQGAYPFAVVDLALPLAVCVALLIVVPREQQGLRRVVWLYIGALLASFVVPTPIGANADRFGRYLALPFLICVAWPGRKRILALLAIPAVSMAWLPAVVAILKVDDSVEEGYYAPVVAFLDGEGGRPGRVEVVPTEQHWEAAFVAPELPLARGWERQVDIAENPIFYEDGLLDATSYLAWLHDNGVRWVALPDATLDRAADAEGELLRAGVPGLDRIWQNRDWIVYEVTGSDGIVSGPADLVALEGETIDLVATGAGTVTVRVRDAAQWEIRDGLACLVESESPWLEIRVGGPGPIRLELDATDGDTGTCDA